MKDSVKGLIDKGKSIVLSCMAERIGNAAESIGATQSVNVMNATVLNGVPGGEIVRPVSRVNRVFRIADNNDLFEVDRNADRIEVMKGVCNDRDIEKWDLLEFRKLKELIIEEKCFQFVKELKVRFFAFLENVVIGRECFTKGKGVLEISYCDGLKNVRICKDSFVHWSGFVMRNCGVEEVEIGDGCFVDCEKVVFESGREGIGVKSRFGETENSSSRGNSIHGRCKKGE